MSAAFDPSSLPIAPEQAGDRFGVEAVVAAAFGPGRFAKTAERLREGQAPIAGFVARDERRIVGSVRLWPIRIGLDPAAFLGPIAVDEANRQGGLGARLVEHCVTAAEGLGLPVILLVGDMPFFGRFGFRMAQRVALPGPVDPSRLLVKMLRGDAPAGVVTRGWAATSDRGGWRDAARALTSST
jgi:predicted N-acetyltransferase YhbS